MTITTTQQRDGTWAATTTRNGATVMVASCPTEQDAIDKLGSLLRQLEATKQ